MMPSIRRRLLITLLSVTTLLWLLTIIESYNETQHEIEELFDAQLAQSARTLLTVSDFKPETAHDVSDSHLPFAQSDDEDRHSYEKKLAYQLWSHPQGELLLRSAIAPQSPLSTRLNGYSTEDIDGKSWRIFSLYDAASGQVAKTGQSLAIRQELSEEITQRLALPMLVALPLLSLLIYIGIGRALRPLQRLARSISEREADRLERVDTKNVPSEIVPLVDALNQLFARVEQSMESERRFTANAAHELRTPLAALKVQAQVAQRSHDAEERNHALARLGDGIERAARLVGQLLTLARLTPETARDKFTTLALRPIAEEVLATLEPLAAKKGITLELDAEAVPAIEAQMESIAVMLRNLVDNAIRYTPPGGSVAIAITALPQAVVLRVADSGPGIPEQERERIFNRFYRLAGQEIEGSGLGLSIVKGIADLHQADIELGRSSLGGLEVSISFPRPHP